MGASLKKWVKLLQSLHEWPRAPEREHRFREAMPLSQTPTYSIKAVLNETGIAADTLRAWERRYGVPMPERTPGGHRLYSQRDIHLIKWLLARQAEGLSISKAVKQWHTLIASGADPLGEARRSARRGSVELHKELGAACDGWLSACLRFDEAAAERVLNRAFAAYTVETVVNEVILHGLHEVGARWQRGQATVQQEHFISGLAIRRLDALIASAPIAAHAPAVVLACPPAELHSLPLLYLNLMLRRRGRHVVFLGPDVPLEQLEDSTRTAKAALVIMGAQRLATASALRDAAALLASRRIPVAYGGYVFNRLPKLRERVAGEFISEAIEDSVDRIEELLAGPVTAQDVPPAPASFPAQAFRTLRSEVEAAMRRRLAGQAEQAADLAIANSYFGNALLAALELGDIAYLETDMGWLSFLLTRPRLPFDTIRPYLETYAIAVRQVMESTGGEIADCLDGLAAKA